MSYKSISGTLGKRGRTQGSGHPSALTAILRKARTSPTGAAWGPGRVSFRIQPPLWTAAGWNRGDKVVVLWDEETRCGLIQRDDSGYALSLTAGGYDLMFLVPYDPTSGFPELERQTGLADPTVTAEGIAFRVPNGS